MKTEIFTSVALGLTLAVARPVNQATALMRREVPQEHSHEQFITTVRTSLNIDNPDKITDPVLALLGNAAAAKGLGDLKDPECLQQETADRAFTNAKAAGDVDGMTAALVFRALERNTGSVGLKSNACTSAVPVNAEIAAIAQHQDPASDGAAAANKAIVLELAKQINSVGGDPQTALKSGTFAPGKIGDPTAAGNTCDTQDDPTGCIFSQNLLVEDASAAEIDAAVAGAGGAAGAAGNATAAAGSSAAAANATAAAANASVAAANVSAVAANATVAASNSSANATASKSPDKAAAASLAASANAQKAKGGYKWGSKGKDSCSNPAIAYGKGKNFGGSSKASFRADDTVVFVQDSSQDVIVIASSICDTLEFQCGAEVIAIQQCRQTLVVIDGVGNSQAAVIFNNALGVVAVNFGVDQSASNTVIIIAREERAAPAIEARAALDLGSCADPTIIFGPGLDGRKEDAFAPNDETTFTHGSALNIKVISDFICGQLESKCKAGADAVSACQSGASAAAGASGQAAADAFNAVFA